MGIQKDVLMRKMFEPGAVTERNASLMLTRLPITSDPSRSCCHTTYSVLPARHSQRNTTLLRNDSVLKSRFLRVNVLPARVAEEQGAGAHAVPRFN